MISKEDNADYSDSNESDDQAILDRINQGVNNWVSYFNTNYQNARDDKYFVYVNNYTKDQIRELTRHGKPVLQMNMIYDSLNKVVGEQRQNTAELEVRSLNGKAPDELVQLNQDFVRYICFNSKSKNAYQTAFLNQVSCGFGAFRIRNDYARSMDFHQSIFIDQIIDSENTIFDVIAQDSTRCDGNHVGYFVTMSKKEFERLWPDIPYPTSFPRPTFLQPFLWGNKNSITIMEWYEKEWFDFKLHKLSDGQVVKDSEWKKMQEQFSGISSASNEPFFNGMSFMPEIEETITKKDCKIVCYKAIYNKIIEKKYIPGNELPIIFVPGPLVSIEGEDIVMSFVRFAKDAQTFRNITLVEIAHCMQTARRERFIGTKENVAGVEEIWQDVSTVQGILPAIPHPVTGAMPIPLPPAEIPMSLMNIFQQSERDIHNILGFYEANRGADSLAKSGIAYKEQQKTGNMSVAVFYDNLNRAIEQAGRVVMSMKSEIYDTERSIPITDQNGKTSNVMINQPIAGGLSNDMTKGDFDIVIAAGPSGAVQKSQSLEVLMQVCSLDPQVFRLLADKIGENLSLDGIASIVKRLKTLVPPDVLAMEEGKPPPPQPPNPQMMMAQQQMQIKEKDQEIQQGKLMFEMQKLQTQVQQLEKEIQVTQIKAQAEVQKAAIEHNSTMVETTGKIIDSHNNVKRELIK